MTYAELATTTNFTFLTGASHPEEMVERAAELGLAAIAITDRNTLAGVVRAHVRLRELRREATRIKPRNINALDVVQHARIRSQSRTDPSSRLSEEELRARFTQAAPVAKAAEPARYATLPKLIIGARLVFTDTPLEVIALAPTRIAYARLCRLLTRGKRLAEKGKCALTFADLCRLDPGLILIACPPDPLAPPPQETRRRKLRRRKLRRRKLRRGPARARACRSYAA